MVDWLLFLTRETTFVSSSLTSSTQPSCENRSSLKGKGSKFFPMSLGRVVTLESVSIPKGSKFLPFRVDPLQKGGKTILNKLSPLVYPFSLND